MTLPNEIIGQQQYADGVCPHVHRLACHVEQVAVIPRVEPRLLDGSGGKFIPEHVVERSRHAALILPPLLVH